jgi:hypothetical protein
MKLDWSEPVTDRGKPAVRSFLRRTGGRAFSSRDVAEWFKLSDQKAAALTQELLAREWIVPAKDGGGRAQPGWFRSEQAGIGRLSAGRVRSK